ncbi:YciI family protein [Antrihabitans stalactiti]|jgi:hypothetical protein|uniref:YCII-related domain-containing protein n=1 Tax=Antrihabitans stalactiti TaxID=2584121 RepID=A0A848K4T2_9NOCA|nr:YciI family protein [Antrihabitans stalactiti]NMN93611.1 hypothetical protein [Antrihabitans stalactiti]
MAQYLVLIYEDESGYANGGADIWAEIGKEHTIFAENAGAAIVGGNALQPTATATSIRKNSSGDIEVTDAPFAEAKEALGGYYLLEAPDLDAAIALAKQVPARFGGVEVRPIMVFE